MQIFSIATLCVLGANVASAFVLPVARPTLTPLNAMSSNPMMPMGNRGGRDQHMDEYRDYGEGDEGHSINPNQHGGGGSQYERYNPNRHSKDGKRSRNEQRFEQANRDPRFNNRDSYMEDGPRQFENRRGGQFDNRRGGSPLEQGGPAGRDSPIVESANGGRSLERYDPRAHRMNGESRFEDEKYPATYEQSIRDRPGTSPNQREGTYNWDQPFFDQRRGNGRRGGRANNMNGMNRQGQNGSFSSGNSGLLISNDSDRMQDNGGIMRRDQRGMMDPNQQGMMDPNQRGMMDGPGRQMNGPGRHMDGPGRQMDGPGRQMNGPGNQMNGPGRQMDGPGRQMDGPGRQMDGPGRQTNGGPGRQTNGGSASNRDSDWWSGNPAGSFRDRQQAKQARHTGERQENRNTAERLKNGGQDMYGNSRGPDSRRSGQSGQRNAGQRNDMGAALRNRDMRPTLPNRDMRPNGPNREQARDNGRAFGNEYRDDYNQGDANRRYAGGNQARAGAESQFDREARPQTGGRRWEEPYRAGDRTMARDTLNGPQRLDGGTRRQFTFEANVGSVQLEMWTEGLPLMATVEIFEKGGQKKNSFDVYLEDGHTRPYSTVLDLPRQSGGTILIRNDGPVEYPLVANVQPSGAGGQQNRDQQNRNQDGW